MDALPQVEVTPVTHQCIVRAAEQFELPTTLIYSVLKVEGGHPGLKKRNTNGSYDLGPMQINTLWLKKFKSYVSEAQIKNDGCVNVMVGSWILRAQINQAGGDFWKGVGNYHSRTPHLHKKYQWKVYNMSKSLG